MTGLNGSDFDLDVLVLRHTAGGEPFPASRRVAFRSAPFAWLQRNDLFVIVKAVDFGPIGQKVTQAHSGCFLLAEKQYRQSLIG